ncbi:MAG: clan AA aspartic protease [Bacteroidetes bacterium]|nr:clan AA aspartic protease [Bacteroidota bacterium]
MKYEIPISLVEIEKNNYHLFVSIIFNDEETGDIIIDTGASKTIFDTNRLKKYSKIIEHSEEIRSSGINANLTDTQLVTVNKIQIGDFSIKNFKAVLLNLDHINSLYADINNKKIWGLLGGDFLNKYKAKIDYEKKLLTLKVKNKKP